MSDLSSWNLLGGFYPTMFCSEMRCSCSQQTFILSIFFNHIPSTEKKCSFLLHNCKNNVFSCFFSRVDLKWPGSVMGWRPKNPQGFKQSQIIFPYPPPPPPHTHTHTHTHKEKQTNRQKQKEKIRSLMKPHWHKKYLVKFSTPKNQGIRKPPPPPPPKKEKLSITSLFWNPDLSRVTGSILRWFTSFIKIKLTSLVVLFWHISMMYIVSNLCHF